MVRIGADCFQRGDCNNDGQLDMSDAVTALLHLFAEGQIVVPVTCLDACDGNDDGELDISDPIRELDWIFNGGPALPPPFLTCDVDGTVDALGCELFSFCED
jgi:hypothetical protein